MIKALIINYNRLILPRNMADYLSECEITPIIIDNCSDYPPLLEYYKTCKHEVYHADRNYGHNVIWKLDLLTKLNITGDYIISDSDLDICNVPKDFLSVLQRGLDIHTEYEKCGFGLRISDLPNNKLRDYVITTERGYWDRPLDNTYYDASVDTTFSLCRSRVKVFKSMRTNEPYCAKHVPWYYTTLGDMTDDEKYYFSTIKTSTYFSEKIATNLMKTK